QGADHPRRRQHLAVRGRGGAEGTSARRRRGRIRDPGRAVRRGGRCRGRADGRERRARAPCLVPRAAGAVQGAAADLPARRDSPDADGKAPAGAHRRPADRRRLVRFVVLGAGAIGAYVGAALARGGVDVTLVARGEQLRALQEDGVQVLSGRGNFEARPPATGDWSVIGDADVVILGLKAYSLTAAAPRLGELLRPGAAVGCVVYCSTELVAPGVVRHLEGTRFSLGEPDRSVSERCNAISDAFRAGGLKAPVERDLRSEIWLKLLGNATFNPISALTRATLRELGTTDEMRTLLRATFDEIAAVAVRLGITFPVSLDRRLEAGFAVGDHKTSMLQDLENGKPLEYQCMTGAVVELARRLELATPRLDTIHACIDLVDRLRAEQRATPLPDRVGV